MMRKIFSLLALVLPVVLFYFYFFPKQPNNIFDEIYQETEKTYHTNNILRNIDGFKISPGWPSDDPNISYTPFGKYETLPKGYSDITINFNFGEGIKGVLILFERKTNSNITLWYSAHYNMQKKVLKKELAIFEEPRKPGQFIDDEEKVREYTDEKGADISLECAGSVITQEQALLLTKKHGKVGYLGIAYKDVTLKEKAFESIFRKELTLKGFWNSYSAPFPGREWTNAIELISKNKIDVESLITHKFALKDVDKAFEMILGRTEPFGKVLILPEL